jgi:DNA repair ATPase RecN
MEVPAAEDNTLIDIKLGLRELTTLFTERTDKWTNDIAENRRNIGEAFKRIEGFENKYAASDSSAKEERKHFDDRLDDLTKKYEALEKLLQKTREVQIRISAITSAASAIGTALLIQFFSKMMTGG